MENRHCPKCSHKSLRFRDAFKTYICNYCKEEFDNSLNPIEKGVLIDDLGNKYKVEIKKEDDKTIVTKTYFLEKGKTTLRTEHKKLKENSECKYPNRLSCNHGYGFERCPFMKYNNSTNSWFCDKK